MNVGPTHEITEEIISILERDRISKTLLTSANYWRSLVVSEEYLKKSQTIQSPHKHLIHTYHLISEYIEDNISRDASFYPLSNNHIKLLGLLHRLRIPKHFVAQHEQTQNGSTELFWDVISDYSLFYDKVVNNYIDACNYVPRDLNKVDELNDQDVDYLKLGQALISESSLSKKGLINAFYLLLFFDLYAALEVAADSGLVGNYIKNKSLFCLRILPHLIGAYRFGEFHNKLKDNAFQLLDRELFFSIEKEIEKNILPTHDRSVVVGHIKEISSQLGRAARITSRTKSVCSAFLKSNTYHIPVSQLWDLFAVRIVIDSSDDGDCYRYLSYIEKRWERWRERKGYYDYIAKPKANGYQSLHLVMLVANKLVEIQIRTRTMDAIAEFGAASHLSVYKAQNNTANINDLAITDVGKGRKLLDLQLRKQGLRIDDFIEHLQAMGNVLEVVPIEHYYEGIATGKYDTEVLVSQIKKKGVKR